MSSIPVEDLIIVGAGGSSKSIAWAVREINERARRWNLLGFLDDDPVKKGQEINGLPVLGRIDAAAEYPAAKLIVGIASYRDRGGRRRVVERLGCPPERFATVIAPSARVSPHARIGHGTAVLECAVIAPGATVGDHVLISASCAIGHDAMLHDFVTLATSATVAGSARLQEDAYAGAGSVVRDGIEVGEGALVGLGAAVLRNVAAGDTVIGNPAHSLRKQRHCAG